MQILAVPYVGTRTDLICKAGTGTGKSTVYHMMAHPWISRGETSVYIGIMKALAAEKVNDWANPLHPWSRVNKALLTGDTSDDPARQRQLENAQLICATPEAMISKVWKHKSKDNGWIKNITSICMDEIHLSGQEGRGTQMEVLIKEMARINPNIQIIALSGTLPNIEDFVQWISNVKHGRAPVVIDSDWRPVEIKRTYHPVLFDPPKQSFDEIETILDSYPEDKQFMIAVWNKSLGRKMQQFLEHKGIDVDFHNGDRQYSDRQMIETRFRSRNLRVLISTSTLFTGVNLPADGMIVPTVYWRGQQDIPYTEIGQALGRAGRVGLSPEGYQHVCIPAHPGTPEWNRHVYRIENGEPIISQMQYPHELACHFLGAVSCGAVNNLEDFKEWFKTTLWAVQGPKIHKEEWNPEKLCEVTALNMSIMRMLRPEEFEEGNYVLTTAGKIAAQMLLDPYHWSDLIINVSKVCQLSGTPTYGDWASAYGCCREFKLDYDVPQEANDPLIQGLYCPKGYAKALYVLMRRAAKRPFGESNLSMSYALDSQLERWMAALVRLKREANFFKEINIRSLATFCLRLRKDYDQPTAQADLDLFDDFEIVSLMGLGIFGSDEARQKAGVSAKVLSSARCAELRIRPGASKAMNSLLNPVRKDSGRPTRPAPAPPTAGAFMKLFMGDGNG